jgi:beta-fructofuranosidase
MYYRPKDAVAADVIPFYKDGEFKLFYLKDYRDIKNKGEGTPWHFLTTKDLINYVDHGEAIPRGKVDDQDLYIFTGSVIEYNKIFYIFYTGHNPHKRAKGLDEQTILMAESDNLKDWKKVKKFELRAPEWLVQHDFRDPFVYYDDKNKEFRMLFAARKKDGTDRRNGITGLATSQDLFNWQIQKKPFYDPSCYFTHECPDLFKMGDWWYLLFSTFTDKVVTHYRMSRNIDGPWETPPVDTFDGHAYYAAKSTKDKNGRRILFGWNPIKNEEKDEECWQWGGTIIPHELCQDEKGYLWVKCPEEIKSQYTVNEPVKVLNKSGNVVIKENDYNLGFNTGFSKISLTELPQYSMAEAEFTIKKQSGQFGFIVNFDNQTDRGYYIKFEPLFNRLSFERWPRKISYYCSDIETERYCHLNADTKNKITIIREGSVLEVYVNDKVSMSARMFDYKSGSFGLFAQDCEVDFNNIKISKIKE